MCDAVTAARPRCVRCASERWPVSGGLLVLPERSLERIKYGADERTLAVRCDLRHHRHLQHLLVLREENRQQQPHIGEHVPLEVRNAHLAHLRRPWRVRRRVIRRGAAIGGRGRALKRIELAPAG